MPLVLPILAWIAQSSSEIELGHSRVAGVATNFSVKADLEIGTAKISLEGKAKEEVKTVGKDAFVLEVRQFANILKFNAQTLEQPDATFVRTYSSEGRLLEITGASVDADTYRRQTLIVLYLPKRTYKIGDKWKLEEPANEKRKTPGCRLTYTLVGIDSEGAHIHSEAEEKGISNSMRAQSDFWIDPKTGAANRLSYKVQNLPFRDQFGKASIEIKRS